MDSLINSLPEESEKLMLKQIQECRDTHDIDLGPDVTYFELAEPAMDAQWTYIYENIKSFVWDVCLELAPGHGRNSNKLKENSKELHLVDVNVSSIEACRKRFSDGDGNCRFYYYVNDGYSLKEIADRKIQFLYSWDAMVHFDKLVVKDYVRELFRVMQPGSHGFVHHSNYGTINPSNEWMKNPGWRSNLTTELFNSYCQEFRLNLIKQQIIHDGLDCISIFSKPKT
jgi:ubiquinone/menaquinone biosynthesis C-methylase UbiE